MQSEDVLVVEWIISHKKMCKIVKLLNSKKHAHKNYWFEVEDLVITRREAEKHFDDTTEIYDDYAFHWKTSREPMVKMRVFKNVCHLS
jgi:hypothetical protein